MEKTEADKVAEALINWLDSQNVAPSDGVQAMSMAIGSMIAHKSYGLTHMIEGLHLSYQLINVTALECMQNAGKAYV